MATATTTRAPTPIKSRKAPSAPSQASTPAPRKFTRSSTDKWVAGIAGGLARYFNIDVRLMRVLTLVACLTGAGLLVYIILWIVIPLE